MKQDPAFLTIDRPLPELAPETAEFFRACLRGELLIEECTACGARQHYPRGQCIRCGGETRWKRARGEGTVHTFTVIHFNVQEPFVSQTPYVVAMIDLPEGVRMLTNIVGCSPEAVQIGMPVRVAFAALKADPAIVIPVWKPA